MELWDGHVDLRQIFEASDIPNIRVNLGNELYFSPKNQTDKSLVNRLYREVILLFLLPTFVYSIRKLTLYTCIFYFIVNILVSHRDLTPACSHRAKKTLCSDVILGVGWEGDN